MKKIISLILTIILALPIFVKADMGAPEIKPYEAYVVKADGADYYDSYCENSECGYKKVGKLEYDTKIKVYYEQEIDGLLYAQFDNGYILISDIIPVVDKFEFSEEDEYIYKLENYTEVTVLKEEGIEMHKGPANGYSIIGSIIPKNTKLKYIYEASDCWLYVEYNGIKGWISILEGSVGWHQEEKILISKDLEIKLNDKILGKIPANTSLNNYYSIDAWSWGYYVTYDGVSGYIPSSDASISNGTYSIISENSKTLYESANLNSKVLVEKIPANTKLIYSNALGHHWTEWIYTTYDGKTGWVYYDYDESEETIEEKISNDPITTTNKVTTTTTIPNKIGVQKSMLTGDQIVILCIGLAVILSLTAIVIIILINKKKTNVVKTTQSSEEINNNEK